VLLNSKNISWVGVAGGVATLVLIVVSVFVPWWKLAIGSPSLAEVSFSPVNLNFSVLGSYISIPLILALNVAAFLTLASGGIVMLIYSVFPNRSYSKRLLGFSYSKPVVAVVFFVVELVALSVLVKNYVGFSFPLIGESSIQLPGSVSSGMNVSVAVFAGFEWPFYFAIAVSVLCVFVRYYHRKIARTDLSLLPPAAPVSSVAVQQSFD
jgi:hypothetical protein